MRTSIVFTNILANHAAAELSLAFISVVFLLDGVLRFVEHDGIGRYGFCAKQRVLNGLNFNAQEVHQSFVVMGKAYHQIIIHTMIVLDAVLFDVNLLAAGGQLVMPFPVEFRKPSGEFLHLRLRPFSIVDATLFKIGLHLLV